MKVQSFSREGKSGESSTLLLRLIGFSSAHLYSIDSLVNSNEHAVRDYSRIDKL